MRASHSPPPYSCTEYNDHGIPREHTDNKCHDVRHACLRHKNGQGHGNGTCSNSERGLRGGGARQPKGAERSLGTDLFVAVHCQGDIGLLQLRGGGPLIPGAGVARWLEDSDYEAEERSEIKRRSKDQAASADQIRETAAMQLHDRGRPISLADALGIEARGQTISLYMTIDWDSCRNIVGREGAGGDEEVMRNWDDDRRAKFRPARITGSNGETRIEVCMQCGVDVPLGCMDGHRCTVAIASTLSDESGGSTCQTKPTLDFGRCDPGWVEMAPERETMAAGIGTEELDAGGDGAGSCQECGLQLGTIGATWRICRCSTLYCSSCAAGPCSNCAADPVLGGRQRGA